MGYNSLTISRKQEAIERKLKTEFDVQKWLKEDYGTFFQLLILADDRR
jgi:hypothetical protein